MHNAQVLCLTSISVGMNRLIWITCCWLQACSMSGQKYEYQTPVSRNDGWKIGSLLSQGIDTSYFNRFFDTLATSETHGLHSFLVIKNDTLVLEKYFDSQQLNSSHDLRSTTKSITSLLVGIALDKGFISSIDDPVALYLKPYWPSAHKDSLKNTLTIRHLLPSQPELR